MQAGLLVRQPKFKIVYYNINFEKLVSYNIVCTTILRGVSHADAVWVYIIYHVKSSAMKSGNKTRQYRDGACEEKV